MRNLEPSDYNMGPSFTKEISLIGKDKKFEKLRVMQKPSLFNKNLKVRKMMSKLFVKEILTNHKLRLIRK